MEDHPYPSLQQLVAAADRAIADLQRREHRQLDERTRIETAVQAVKCELEYPIVTLRRELRAHLDEIGVPPAESLEARIQAFCGHIASAVQTQPVSQTAYSAEDDLTEELLVFEQTEAPSFFDQDQPGSFDSAAEERYRQLTQQVAELMRQSHDARVDHKLLAAQAQVYGQATADNLAALRHDVAEVPELTADQIVVMLDQLASRAQLQSVQLMLSEILRQIHEAISSANSPDLAVILAKLEEFLQLSQEKILLGPNEDLIGFKEEIKAYLAVAQDRQVRIEQAIDGLSRQVDAAAASPARISKDQILEEARQRPNVTYVLPPEPPVERPPGRSFDSANAPLPPPPPRFDPRPKPPARDLPTPSADELQRQYDLPPPLAREIKQMVKQMPAKTPPPSAVPRKPAEDQIADAIFLVAVVVTLPVWGTLWLLWKFRLAAGVIAGLALVLVVAAANYYPLNPRLRPVVKFAFAHDIGPIQASYRLAAGHVLQGQMARSMEYMGRNFKDLSPELKDRMAAFESTGAIGQPDPAHVVFSELHRLGHQEQWYAYAAALERASEQSGWLADLERDTASNIRLWLKHSWPTAGLNELEQIRPWHQPNQRLETTTTSSAG